MVTLRQFNDQHERESWTGLSAAYRAGSKSRALGGQLKYGRADFQEAWWRGWNDMDEYLKSGGVIVDSISTIGEAVVQERQRCLATVKELCGDSGGIDEAVRRIESGMQTT